MEDNKEKYQHGFKVPEGYFDSVEDRLFDALDLEELLKETGFEVPEGYFDGLEDKILEKVQDAPQETKVISIFRQKVFWYTASVAASAAIIVMLFFKPAGGEEEMDLNEPTLAEIEAYLDQDPTAIDSYDLAQVLTDEDWEVLETENTYLDEESLEEYILDNIDDPTIFIE
ncbi:MAG: hypothetical protein KTR22_13445 [Flavobacteriaceae bacterium]|nr:hypothetical protein [Flavobacteriaceae bacterium]